MPTHPHTASFVLALALALRSMHVLSALTLPGFDAELLAVLDGSPSLAAALAPSRPLRRVTLRIASTLYDGLRSAALFGALGSALKELVSVLAPDIDVRTCGRLLGGLANTGAGLELLELRLEGTLDEVSLQALYKQVGSLSPNVQELRTFRLRATLVTEVAKAEEAHRVSRCGDGLRWDRRYAASCFLPAFAGNSGGENGYA